MDDAFLQLFIAVVALAIGFFSGTLVAGARSQSGKVQTRSTELERAANPDRSVVARLWRDRRRGTLMPELDGRTFHTPYELKPEQRERLKRIQADLSTWLGSSAGSGPATFPGGIQAAHPPSLGIVDVVSGAILPGMGKAGPQKRTTTAAGAPGAGPAAQAAAVNSPPQSLAGQIDAILQERLAGSPLESRGIWLGEAPGQEVVVWVGSEQYAGIEAVPDAEVKDLIRKCVREWEQRVDQG